jgi:hypothetical protein
MLLSSAGKNDFASQRLQSACFFLSCFGVRGVRRELNGVSGTLQYCWYCMVVVINHHVVADRLGPILRPCPCRLLLGIEIRCSRGVVSAAAAQHAAL